LQFISPSTSGFPYREFILRYTSVPTIGALANFDGVQYLVIADHDAYYQYQQAYFPLFPLLIKVVGTLIGGKLLYGGLVVSIFGLFCGLILLRKLLSLLPEKNRSVWSSTVYLLLLPGSFFFVSVYTESLFLALFCGTLLLLNRKQYVLAAVTACLLGMTRLVGVFVVIPLVVYFIFPHLSEKGGWLKKFIQSLKPVHLLVILSPLIGLLIYMAYLHITVDDPLAFIHAQKAFNNNRSTSIVLLPQVLYRYFKILTTARLDIAYVVASVEIGIFITYIALLARQFYRYFVLKRDAHWLSWGILLFSITNLLLPTLTGTLSSIPRYGLLSLAVLIEINQSSRVVKLLLSVVFSVINLLMLVLFAQGYFVS
jgi:Gpi18-like mannosyltransferase